MLKLVKVLVAATYGYKSLNEYQKFVDMLCRCVPGVLPLEIFEDIMMVGSIEEPGNTSRRA